MGRILRSIPAFALIVSAGFLWAQEGSQQRVRLEVERMLSSDKGRVLFSDIRNSSQFTPEEKSYATRLYETFFAIPAYLKTVYESDGRIPLSAELSQEFAVDKESIDLLLKVMKSDPRMPPLLELKSSGEIAALDVDKIDAFINSRGSRVRLAGWKGKEFPSFDLADYEGGRLTLADFEGRVALAWVYATRCPVCRDLAPMLAKVHQRFSAEEFTLAGFNVDRVFGLAPTDQERRDFVSSHGLEFENALLDSRTWDELGQVNIVPSLFLVGRDGKVKRLMINITDEDAIAQAVAEALAGP